MDESGQEATQSGVLDVEEAMEDMPIESTTNTISSKALPWCKTSEIALN